MPLRDPNRGFLRAWGYVPALGSAAVITLEDLEAAGLREHAVRWLRRERDICAVDPAFYIFQGKVLDRLARLGRRHKKMTVGLTTALWLSNVIGLRPPVDHWLIPHARWRPIWTPPHTQVHLSRHARDETFIHTRCDIALRVSQPQRALLDCIRFRDVLGRNVVATALKAALEQGHVELNLLMERARLERLQKPLLHLLAELHRASRVPAAAPDVTSRAPCPPESPSSAPPEPRSPAP